MKATDFRDLAWADVQRKLKGQRQRTYWAWLKFGPGTTREVAIKAEMSILTFRPRTTELYEMGLLELAGGRGKEGVYQAVEIAEWQRRMDAARRAAEPVPEQGLLPLGGEA